MTDAHEHPQSFYKIQRMGRSYYICLPKILADALLKYGNAVTIHLIEKSDGRIIIEIRSVAP